MPGSVGLGYARFGWDRVYLVRLGYGVLGEGMLLG